MGCVHLIGIVITEVGKDGMVCQSLCSSKQVTLNMTDTPSGSDNS